MKITDEALEAAASLSHRYITERFLPDKAIDLIDEAASKHVIDAQSMTPELREIKARLDELDAPGRGRGRHARTTRRPPRLRAEVLQAQGGVRRQEGRVGEARTTTATWSSRRTTSPR